MSASPSSVPRRCWLLTMWSGRGSKLTLSPLGPGAQLLQAGGGLVRQLADDGGVVEGLDLDGAREVQLLGLGLGRLVPFLEDLGEGGPVDLDKLLQLVQVVGKLLEALLQRGELGRASGYTIAAGPQDPLLVEERLEPDFELAHASARPGAGRAGEEGA